MFINGYLHLGYLHLHLFTCYISDYINDTLILANNCSDIVLILWAFQALQKF